MTLLEKINEINAETLEWISLGPNRFAGLITDDLDSWKEIGVYTADDLDSYLHECEEKEDRRASW